MYSRDQADRSAPRGRVLALIVVTMILGSTGCRDTVHESHADVALWRASDPGQPERRILTERWDTLAALPGSSEDTLLNYPHRLAVHPGGVYVYDDGARRLVSFDTALCLRAAVGRRGGGPGEFEQVRDLVAMPDGDAALLDPGNARITVLGERGELRKMIPVRNVGSPEKIVSLDRARFLLFASRERGTPFVVIDHEGTVLDRIAHPWGEFARLSSISSQGLLAGNPGNPAEWAFLFIRGNGWFAFDGLRARDVRGRFLEHTDFPVPMQSPNRIQLPANSPVSAVSAGLHGGKLYVLFGGTERGKRYRVIDLFDANDARYLGSYRLPRSAVAIAPSDDGLYVLFHRPYPSIYRLRPRLDESAGGPAAPPCTTL